MKVFGVELNSYSLRARLRPVLFALLPVGFGIAAWFPTELQGLGWLVGVASACGVTFFFAETAADVGRRKQNDLWKKWGGAPTTVHLRHRTSPLNEHTLARYHAKLGELRPDLKIPTQEEETIAPADADTVYESCVDFLREATRDSSKFPMVLADNVNYGYRRNLWGIRSWGLATSVVGLLAVGGRLVHRWATGASGYATPVACGVLCLTFLGLFAFVVREAWVKQAGDSYALRLLAALERL